MIRRIVAVAVAVLGMVSGRASFAQTTYTWTGVASTEFLAAGNWTPAGGPPGTTGAAGVIPNNLNTAVFAGATYSSVGVNLGTDGAVTVGRVSVSGTLPLTLGSSATTAGLGDRFLTLRGTTADLNTPDVVLSAVGGDITIQNRLPGAAADADLTVRLGHASGSNVVFADAGRTVTINSRIGDIGAFTGGTAYGLLKRGGGTLALNGNGSYTGATVVEGGTLQVNGTLYTAGTSASIPVVVGFSNGERGTLGGTGAIPGKVSVNQVGTDYGTLTAGNSAANRTLSTGALDLGGHYRVQLFGTAAEQGSRVDSSGAVTFGGGSVLELALNGQTVNGLRATGAKQYTILTGTGMSGTFSNAATNGGAVDFSSLGFDPAEWTVQYTTNSVVLNFAPVPEPGAVLAVAAASAGLVRLARRRGRLCVSASRAP